MLMNRGTVVRTLSNKGTIINNNNNNDNQKRIFDKYIIKTIITTTQGTVSTMDIDYSA